MKWIWAWLGKRDPRPQAVREPFERREAQARDRHERLARMAVESDVISRTDHPENRPWSER